MLRVTHPHRPGQIGTILRQTGSDVLVQWPNGFKEWTEHHWLRSLPLLRRGYLPFTLWAAAMAVCLHILITEAITQRILLP